MATKTGASGIVKVQVSGECYWDEADAQQLILDERASVDFEIYPTGSGTGETFFSGGGIVTSRSISGAFDGMVEASFTIQCSGAVTEAQV